jgi:predicted RND superfamily exporter protein
VLFGLDFNAANIIALPLILGIGVDNGILILERFRYEPDIELFSRNTGRAILMSNLSTVTGFVALALARHQGIATLGQIMAIGISLTMLTSLIVLPAAIRLLKRRGVTL